MDIVQYTNPVDLYVKKRKELFLSTKLMLNQLWVVDGGVGKNDIASSQQLIMKQTAPNSFLLLFFTHSETLKVKHKSAEEKDKKKRFLKNE